MPCLHANTTPLFVLPCDTSSQQCILGEGVLVHEGWGGVVSANICPPKGLLQMQLCLHMTPSVHWMLPLSEDPSQLHHHAPPWMQEAVLARSGKVLQICFGFLEGMSKQKNMVTCWQVWRKRQGHHHLHHHHHDSLQFHLAFLDVLGQNVKSLTRQSMIRPVICRTPQYRTRICF